MSDTAPIRIVIVDDHEVVRRGLSNYIEAVDGLELVGQAQSGAEAIRLCAEHAPDIVLMDVVLPDMSGPEATEQILADQPDVRVIGLSSFSDRTAITAMLSVGATGYLLKADPIDDLEHVIRAVHTGKSAFAQKVTAILLQPDENSLRPYGLSERELEVLALIVEGLSNPQIAEKLVISRSTVSFHVSSILGKFGVTNRLEAARLAIEKGVLDTNPPSM